MNNLLSYWVKATHEINVESLSQQELEDLFNEAGTFGEAQHSLDNVIEQELQRRQERGITHASLWHNLTQHANFTNRVVLRQPNS
ncbi:hypothetical protein KFU94_11960 [Chloroflexi bacterium TSY]|nr:hypothetical protein [Chloroflexi bacterium TSY]